MPLEASNVLAPDVECKQIGGQDLAPLSGYWQTLFPFASAKIEGRVPTNASSQYLVNSRLNSTKELVVVCFFPKSEQASSEYNNLIQYFIGKE